MALYSDPRGARYTGTLPSAVVEVVLPVASPGGQPILKSLATLMRHLGWSMRLAFSLRRRPPACVVAFGGYACVPILLAATLLRVPRLIHEQNAKPGRVNRVFDRLGSKTVYGMAPPSEPEKAIGNPLRDAVIHQAGRTYQPALESEDFRLLVVGGSQGSRALARLASAACSGLDENLRSRLDVVCQARPEDVAAVRERFRAAGVRARVETFFTDLPDQLVQCHLVLARAGASTLSEIAAIGRPAILLPLPTAANDHQTSNAQSAVECGAAFLVREDAEAESKLAREFAQLMKSPLKLEEMAKAAVDCARLDATRDLAELVERKAK